MYQSVFTRGDMFQQIEAFKKQATFCARHENSAVSNFAETVV